jgi:arabinose operon protein AraL
MVPLPDHLYDAYIFDLDGTVFLGDALLPAAGETLQYLRSIGKKTVFLSNNPTHSRQEYAAKLTRLGVPTNLVEVVTSTTVMVDFLKHNLPKGRLFVVGEKPLQDELNQAGFELTEDSARIDAVIASFDRTFIYRKLQIAYDAIRGGARFYATNSDRFCPIPGGGEPDAAAIIAAIEACTDTKVEVVVGKPSRYMVDAILSRLQVPVEACLMVGDRLETDILLGLDNGIDTALIMTGATSVSDLATSQIRPTYVCRSLASLIP